MTERQDDGMKKIADIYEQFVNNHVSPQQKRKLQLRDTWDSIVDRDIAEFSTVNDVKNDTLIVTVSHPAAAQLLNMRRQQIIDRVRHLFADLKISRLKIK